MRVPVKILDGIAEAVERFLYERAPDFFIQMVTKIFPFVKARPLFTGTRKGQAASGNDAVHVIRSKGLRTEDGE